MCACEYGELRHKRARFTVTQLSCMFAGQLAHNCFVLFVGAQLPFMLRDKFDTVNRCLGCLHSCLACVRVTVVLHVCGLRVDNASS